MKYNCKKQQKKNKQRQKRAISYSESVRAK